MKATLKAKAKGALPLILVVLVGMSKGEPVGWRQSEEDQLDPADAAAMVAMTAPNARALPRQVPACGQSLLGILPGESGIITSPNYPSNYPPNLSCTWWLKTTEGSRLRISCDSIETQSCKDGFYDYALVSPSWNFSTFLLLCGERGKDLKPPFTSTSSGSLMAIHFRTSSKNEFPGFRCKWTSEAAPKPDPLRKFNGAVGCGMVNGQVRTNMQQQVDDDNRIVGGSKTLPQEFPWMVGLSFNSTWFCGGTLISNRHILTAAHCTRDATESRAFLGASNLYQVKQVMSSQTFYEHPYYEPKEIKNDVAIVELPQEVEFSDNLRPICLPLKADSSINYDGVQMIATGWGKTTDTSKISPELNKLNVTVVSNKKCRESYSNIIKDTNICAVGLEGQGTCQGDSGSALQQNMRGLWIQEGIVSFGASTGCSTGYPNGYSRLSHYLDFIASVSGLSIQ